MSNFVARPYTFHYYPQQFVIDLVVSVVVFYVVARIFRAELGRHKLLSIGLLTGLAWSVLYCYRGEWLMSMNYEIGCTLYIPYSVPLAAVKPGLGFLLFWAWGRAGMIRSALITLVSVPVSWGLLCVQHFI